MKEKEGAMNFRQFEEQQLGYHSTNAEKKVIQLLVQVDRKTHAAKSKNMREELFWSRKDSLLQGGGGRKAHYGKMQWLPAGFGRRKLDFRL